jgi:hypothetical protein
MIDPTDVIKFGKRVNYENKVTSEQVMEDHLKQMRTRVMKDKQKQSLKLKDEMEFLTQMKDLEDLENIRKIANI